VNLVITNHTEHTLTEKVALLVGVNKHLKCNIGLVCESRMLWLPLTPLKKGRMGAIALRLKQEGMPAIALRLKQAIERVLNQ
jgi:hypothetical protein